MYKLLFLFFAYAFALSPFAQVLQPGEIYSTEHNRTLIPYPKVREADVMWQRRIWRTIDLREKMNQYLYYPFEANNGRLNLFAIIQQAIADGQVQPYDPLYDDFKLSMTKEVALSIGVDTIYYEDYDPNPPYDPIRAQRVEQLNPADITKYYIKEDWFFDKARSVMEVRILGICPVRTVRNQHGEVLGEQMMYWIYFPELRSQLIQHSMYNRYNNAQEITYDDAFTKRLFSSYIHKVDNVYDRRISDYKVGLDALLESEQIKDDIRLYEHDLWEP